MKISILGTGSSGNSIYIEDEKHKILVDAGFSGKQLKEKMEGIDRNIEDVESLFITHEHGDHIMGAGVLHRRYNLPIYITRESYEAGLKKLGKVNEDLIYFINGDFSFGSLKIKVLDVLHDAERTVAFKIENHLGKKVGLATDIGKTTSLIKYEFSDLDLLVIESNYDFQMLMDCSYPMELKNRVKSNNGHLGNEECSKFVFDIYHKKLQKVYLAHISKDSNTSQKAFDTVSNYLGNKGVEVEVEAVPQGIYTKLYHIK